MAMDISEARAKVIAKAWSDADFKAQLLEDPRAALSEMGARLADNIKVVVVEDTADTAHIVLPNPPSDMELSESDLDAIAAGSGAENMPWID